MAKNGKSWAVMIYLAGDNNLAEEMFFHIQELYDEASIPDIDIFVQFEAGGQPWRYGPKTFEGPQESDPKRKQHAVMERREHADLWKLGDRVKVKKTDTAAGILRRFVSDCIKESTADRYALILSGHGSGATGDFLTSDVPGSRLSIPDLSKVFEGVKEGTGEKTRKREPLIDILGMDSCLMGMAEVAYQVKGHVHFMIAAEGFELNTGWPYRDLLKDLKEGLDSASDILAKMVVRLYSKYYRNYVVANVSTDLTALHLSKLDHLTYVVNELAKKMRANITEEGPKRDAIVLAHWEAQSYKDDQHVDLYDFCDCLLKRDPSLAVECKAVTEAIESVVLQSCWTGAAFQHSHGLSVFFPWANIKDVEGETELDHYGRLTWGHEENGREWVDFLREYVKYTQRLPRGCKDLAELEADQEIEDPRKRKFRESLLNRRFGYFRSRARQVRYDPPESMYDPPESMFGGAGGGQIGNTKNPPIHFKPDVCG